jgi:hypothetical protein
VLPYFAGIGSSDDIAPRRRASGAPVAAAHRLQCRAMSAMNPTDPKIDRWLRKQPPRVELALRYSIRGRLPKAKANRAFSARIDELFAAINPSEDEHADILRHAREIGATMERELAGT